MSRIKGVGLTLSGGGFSGVGAVTGFSSAFDLFLRSRSILDLAAYSGVSAGAIIGSYLASGISPHDIIRATLTKAPDIAYVPFRRRDLYRPNVGELPKSIRRFGQTAWGMARRLIDRGERENAPLREQKVLGFLPSSALSNRRLEEIIRLNLERYGTNDFSSLPCRLRVVFYDLVANERIVAGNRPGDFSDIPISEAVAASAAIPGVFPPQRILRQRRLLLGVDGGTAGVTLDVRGEEDLDLLIAYNHMGYAERPHVEHASAIAVVNLSRQLLMSQRNLDEIANYMDANPARHVLVFESPPTSLTGMLSYAAALSIARDTFALTQDWLRRHTEYFGLLFEQHGIEVNPDFARVTFDDIVQHGSAIRDWFATSHDSATTGS